MWFDSLYRQHAPKMIRVAHRVLGNFETAEDVVQNVFLIAHARQDQLRELEKPSAWLYKTLRFQIGNELQRNKNRPTKSLEELPTLEAELENQPLENCLPSTLSAKEREILILFYEKQLAHEEIAQELGISIMTSRTRLFRAKEQYKKIFLKNLKKM